MMDISVSIVSLLIKLCISLDDLIVFAYKVQSFMRAMEGAVHAPPLMSKGVTVMDTKRIFSEFC